MFDWRTEEAHNWDEALAPETETAVSHHPPRRWPWIVLLLAVVLAGSGFMVYHRLNQRVDTVENRIEQDVRSSHRLVRQAAQQEDVDLFISLLSGRDDRWASAQEELVAAGGLLDRASLGLHWSPQALDADQSVVSMTISPDLSKANVQFREQYTTWNPAVAMTETVALRQTAVYRRGSERWLFSPPDSDFWGEWITNDGRLLTLTYPERDAALGRRLAADLEDGIHRVCALPKLNCSPTLHLHVRLQTHPGSLEALSSERALYRNRSEIVLPAPTLVGLPLDDAGYDALLRGYSSHLAGHLIAQVTGYRCCENRFLFRVLLHRQLHELGWQPWPVEPALYEDFLAREVALGEVVNGIRPFLDAPYEDVRSLSRAQTAYALVDFILAANPHVTVVQLHRALAPEQMLYEWITRFVSNEQPLTAEGRWQRFVYQQAPSVRDRATVALPDDPLLMVCDQQLYEYDLARDEVTSLPVGLRVEQTARMPDGGGVWLAGPAPEGRSWRIVVWRGGVSGSGQERLLWERPYQQDAVRYSARMDPSGRNLSLMTYIEETDSIFYEWIDLSRCQQGECPAQRLTAPVSWSPNGKRTLYKKQASQQRAGFSPVYELAVGNRQGQAREEIGLATHAVWLGNVTFAYATRLEEPFSPLERLHIVTVDGETIETLKTADFLEALTTAGMDRPSPLAITDLMVSPQDRDQLFVLAAHRTDERGIHQQFLFRYRRETGELAFLTTLPPPLSWLLSELLSFSPNGRFISIVRLMGGERIPVLFLYDLATGTERELLSLAYAPELSASARLWSADGEWLAVGGQGDVRLVALNDDTLLRFVHGYGDCTELAWSP